MARAAATPRGHAASDPDASWQIATRGVAHAIATSSTNTTRQKTTEPFVVFFRASLCYTVRLHRRGEARERVESECASTGAGRLAGSLRCSRMTDLDARDRDDPRALRLT